MGDLLQLHLVQQLLHCNSPQALPSAMLVLLSHWRLRLAFRHALLLHQFAWDHHHLRKVEAQPADHRLHTAFHCSAQISTFQVLAQGLKGDIEHRAADVVWEIEHVDDV